MVESFDYASVGSPWHQKECYRTDSDPWAFPSAIIPRAPPQGPVQKGTFAKATLDGLDGVEVTAQVGQAP